MLDRGNLAGPANPWLPAQHGYRHLDEVAAWNHGVHDAVLAELGLDRARIDALHARREALGAERNAEFERGRAGHRGRVAGAGEGPATHPAAQARLKTSVPLVAVMVPE